MSKVGKVPVKILDGVSVEIANQTLKLKGKLGEMEYNFPKQVNIVHDNDNAEIVCTPANETKEARALWGTARSTVDNIMTGVSTGYKIDMELKGTGYRAKLAASGNILELSLGYSHDIKFAFPKDIKIEVPSQTELSVSGIDKQKVGQIAAEIRSFRKPEPYKGKGVHRKGDFVRRKEGKKK